jgi:phosphatidylserine decarboxylase
MAFRESLPFLILGLVLTALAFFLLPGWTALFPLLLTAYVAYFFRDPERPVPQDPACLVSPADGKVIAVDVTEETRFGLGSMKRVGIFLSVFDVHINRSPADGRLKAFRYEKGLFLDARDPEVDIKNESQSWHIETPRGSVVMRQISGLIARRIVWWKKEGDSLSKGERVGLIRFGSRTDLYLPLACEILVKNGDHVQGGATVLARWPQKT